MDCEYPDKTDWGECKDRGLGRSSGLRRITEFMACRDYRLSALRPIISFHLGVRWTEAYGDDDLGKTLPILPGLSPGELPGVVNLLPW